MNEATAYFPFCNNTMIWSISITQEWSGSNGSSLINWTHERNLPNKTALKELSPQTGYQVAHNVFFVSWTFSYLLAQVPRAVMGTHSLNHIKQTLTMCQAIITNSAALIVHAQDYPRSVMFLELLCAVDEGPDT